MRASVFVRPQLHDTRTLDKDNGRGGTRATHRRTRGNYHGGLPKTLKSNVSVSAQILDVVERFDVLPQVLAQTVQIFSSRRQIGSRRIAAHFKNDPDGSRGGKLATLIFRTPSSGTVLSII